MSATLIGSLNAGQLNPICVQTLGSAGAQLSAQLTAALALQAQVTVGVPSLATQLQVLEEAAVAISAGIAQGLPGVTFSVSMAATLVASLQAQLGLLGQLTALLGGPAMFVYSYSGGTVSTLGADLTAGIAGSPPPGLVGSSAVAGILLGAGATAWLSIKPYFGGVP